MTTEIIVSGKVGGAFHSSISQKADEATTITTLLLNKAQARPRVTSLTGVLTITTKTTSRVFKPISIPSEPIMIAMIPVADQIDDRTISGLE